nr:reverse transcriptase domain-containing protein [Tanacetum cinerariifolium]
MTKSRPQEMDSKDPPRGRSRARGLNTSREDLKDRECFCSVRESYDDSFSHSYRDGNCSCHMKRKRDNKSPLSNVSRSNSSDGRFMHGVNNLELTKCLNDHVPKTMEEIIITTTAFIRGEAAAASKKIGYASWKAQDRSKRQNSDKSQMVPATTSQTGFSGETIWPLGQLRLLVIIWDTNNFTRAWMNFMIVSTVLIPTECTSVITSSAISREERTRPANFKVALHSDFPDQEVAIEGTLSDKGRTELCSILKKNLDIFAWQPSDMTGVPRTKQSELKRSKEFFNLHMDAGIMKEVYYHDWLSNPVMLTETDEEKTTLHTGQGVYYYTKMPFGLKNVGATYQGLTDKAFESQVGRNIEVFNYFPGFNRRVVKSRERAMSTQQDIYAAGSESHPPMLNKENYVPWSSRLLRYAKSRPNRKVIHNSILNGPYVRRMIAEPGDAERDVNMNETFHEQTDDELSERELKQIEADDQAIQTILLGLLEDIYATVDSCETAREIWL